MTPPNAYNSVTKTLAALPILLLAGFALFIGLVSPNYPRVWGSVFTMESLDEFRALNYKHEMVLVEDLLNDSGSQMVSSLYEANVLFTPGEKEETFKGLILTIQDDKAGDSVLLLEPDKELSDEELELIAEEYESQIPEFTGVELDLDIELSGDPVYRLSPDAKVPVHPVETAAIFHKNQIRVAVIDSGIDPDHEIFDDEFQESGWNVVDDSIRMYDDVGHGTHIAGIIRQNAPTAVIVPYKIVNARGGRLSGVIKAFDKAIDTKVDVINTSFGILSPSPSLQTLVERAADENIALVSAAGNLNSSDGFYPATFTEAFAVAGVDNRDRKMAKSNYGPWVDVAARGNFIWSSLPGNGYGHKSGTSQATAYVTASIANILEEEGPLPLDEILDTLKAQGRLIENGELAGLSIVQ